MRRMQWKPLKQRQICTHADFNIDFVGQRSPKCSKIFLKASQRSRTASGNHCEHLVSTLAMFILQESHCFLRSLAFNRLNPWMPWPYLEWNILSSPLVDLLSIKHPAAQTGDRARRRNSGSVVMVSKKRMFLPLYRLFLIKPAAQFCFLWHTTFGHLFKQFEPGASGGVWNDLQS